jgi:hypothetical protein
VIGRELYQNILTSGLAILLTVLLFLGRSALFLHNSASPNVMSSLFVVIPERLLLSFKNDYRFL